MTGRNVLSMRLRTRLLVLLMLVTGLFGSCVAAGATSAGAVPAADSRPAGALVVYVREGCPHCAQAKLFLAEMQAAQPGLRVELRDIDTDEAARHDLIEVSRRSGNWPPGVPTFVRGERVVVGFDDAEHSGAAIRALLGDAEPGRDKVDSALFGSISIAELGLPLFTLALGLLDGFNPCAMWVLLFLLSLLVRLRDRARMALIAGTFVLVSGAVYYAFMAAWLNVFLAVGMSGTLRGALACAALLIGALNVKDAIAWGHGPSLSIPETAKPGIYARMRAVVLARALSASLAAVALLAVLVNFVELLCTAGFPAIYTAVLAQQALPPTMHYAYLLLYILGYIADDSLMVAIAVAALGSRKLTEHAGRWLKLLSGAVMLALGLMMLLRPQWVF